VNTRIEAAAVLVAAALLGAGCHERRPLQAPLDERESVGTYKGVADPGTGRLRRFRVQLWAALPDRLHAEFSPPVGGPAVIVDAGGGRLSVTLPRERTAYVGQASAAAIGAVTGVSVSLEDLVRWIVLGGGSERGDVRVRRLPERGPGLPRELEIRAGERTLRIERRETFTSAALAAGTGTGAPPSGVVEKPIAELQALDLAGEEPGPVEEP
jgi:hypothetical protein